MAVKTLQPKNVQIRMNPKFNVKQETKTDKKPEKKQLDRRQ